MAATHACRQRAQGQALGQAAGWGRARAPTALPASGFGAFGRERSDVPRAEAHLQRRRIHVECTIRGRGQALLALRRGQWVWRACVGERRLGEQGMPAQAECWRRVHATVWQPRLCERLVALGTAITSGAFDALDGPSACGVLHPAVACASGGGSGNEGHAALALTVPTCAHGKLPAAVAVSPQLQLTWHALGALHGIRAPRAVGKEVLVSAALFALLARDSALEVAWLALAAAAQDATLGAADDSLRVPGLGVALHAQQVCARSAA